jgi:hypothetical protein
MAAFEQTTRRSHRARLREDNEPQLRTDCVALTCPLGAPLATNSSVTFVSV